MKIEYNSKNKNDATSLIFKELYEVSSLSDSGEYVDGKVKKEQIKIVLYSYFYKYKVEENDTWGVLTSKNIEKVEHIEEFYNQIISELVELKMIESYGIISTDGYKLTLLGFKYNLKLKSSNRVIDLFTESEAAITDEISYLKNIKISESKITTLTKDLLEIIYFYKNNYNKKIQIHELIMRYLSSIDVKLSKYSNFYDVERSKLYDQNSLQEIKQMIENQVYSSFRRDLIFYEQSINGLISITPSGVKYLLGDKTTIENKEKLSGLNKEISIIHISDLHFGSSINDGIDNKDNLKGIEGLKVPLFNNFKKIFNDNTSNDTFLIVSGDLTTKNEEKGLTECLNHLAELNINQDNIYIVPGNHDCDRDETNEKVQFSKFISYFSEYNNPFVKNKYILNKELKLFIIGFNSVHISAEDDKQELFYIKEEKIDELIKLADKLSSEIDDFDRYTKLAVVHNNIVPHPSVEVKKYADILNVYKFKYTLNQLGFKFIFSGHKHQSLIERHITYGDDSQGDLLLISAASLCGQVVGEKNGFQIIDIYKDLASDRLNKIVVKEYYSNKIGVYKEEKQYEIIY